MTYKIMSPSDMEPLGAESAAAVANRDAIHEVGGPKRLSQHDQLLLPGQQAPQMKKIFKIKKAVSTKILDPLPTATYDNLIRNGGKQIFRIHKITKWRAETVNSINYQSVYDE